MALASPITAYLAQPSWRRSVYRNSFIEQLDLEGEVHCGPGKAVSVAGPMMAGGSFLLLCR